MKKPGMTDQKTPSPVGPEIRKRMQAAKVRRRNRGQVRKTGPEPATAAREASCPEIRDQSSSPAQTAEAGMIRKRKNRETMKTAAPAGNRENPDQAEALRNP